MIIGLSRSRDADMRVVHTLEVQQVAQTLLIATGDTESAGSQLSSSGGQ